MATEIDERVVEMRFDNKLFEARAKESMSTLDRLKQALSFSKSKDSVDALDQAVQKIDLQGISAGVSALEKRFSTFGIVGMRVIENLTDSAMRFATKGIAFLNDSIVSGGIRRSMNIENAHFQLQALLKDEEKVQAVLDDAMDAVDGTAYAFDEAARAASQFAASGLQAGEDMQKALKGITGVAAMTNSSFEDISTIFTTVAGNGRLMGDQLLQFSARGLNAASTLADYFKEVRGQSNITESTIREMVTKGQLDFKTFSEAMTWAFGDSAKRANETFTGAFANMKSALARIGAGFFSPIVEQNSEVVQLFNSLRERINDVKKSLVFDESLGNINALSKRFTDTVLAISKSANKYLVNLDLTKPLQIMNYGFDSLINVGKGLLSVLKPIGHAFKVIFHIDSDSLLKTASRLADLSSKLIISDKTSKDLRDTAKGLFSVIKILGSGFISLIRVVSPVAKPLSAFGRLILSITGLIGDLVTEFGYWSGKSYGVSKSFTTIASAVDFLMTGLAKGIDYITYFIKSARELEIIQKLAGGSILLFNSAITKFRNFKREIQSLSFDDLNGSSLSLKKILYDLFNIFDKLTDVNPFKWFDNVRASISAIIKAARKNEGFDIFLTNLEIFMNRMGESFTLKTLLSNVNLLKKSMEGFVQWISTAFNRLYPILNKFRTNVSNFLTWTNEGVKEASKHISVGNIIAAGTAIGFIYALIKLAKTFDSAVKQLTSIPKTLTSINGVLKEFQTSLKAKTMLSIAGAITMLVGALVILSFVDTDRLAIAAVSLGVLSFVLLKAFTSLSQAMNAGSFVEQIGTSIKWRSIGKVFKDIAVAFVEITAAIALLAFAYNKDPEAVSKAAITIGIIIGSLTAVTGIILAIAPKIKNSTKTMVKLSTSLIALSASLLVIIIALEKLLKIKLPEDYETKFEILTLLMVELAALMLVLGKTADISNGLSVNIGLKTFVGFAVMLTATVSALNKLFKMNLPDDYKLKLGILTGLFVGLGVLMAVITKLARNQSLNIGLKTFVGFAVMLTATVSALNKLFKMNLPDDWSLKLFILNEILLALAGVLVLITKFTSDKGAIKAFGTLVGICLAIGVAVGALAILSTFPADKIRKGVLALGGILISLAAALAGAGKITTKDSWKAVISMAIAIGTITVSLSVLSLIKWESLMSSAGSLSIVLISLATTLVAAGKASDKIKWSSITLMVGTFLSIAGSLYILSDRPWDRMLSSSIAMSATILSFTSLLKKVSKSTGLKVDKLKVVLGIMLSYIIPITAALVILSDKPWDGILAASTALTMTMIAFAETLKIIGSSRMKIDGKSLLGIAASIVAIGAIALAIEKLAVYDWPSMLGAAASISLLLLALSGSAVIASYAGKAAKEAAIGLLLIDAFLAVLAVTFGTLAAIFGGLAQIDGFKKIITDGGEILIYLGDVIGKFIGNIVSGPIESVMNTLPVLGQSLSDFSDKGSDFFEWLGSVDQSIFHGMTYLAAALMVITSANVIDRLASFITGGNSLVQFGEQLEEFGPHFKSFADSIEGLNPSVVENSAKAALALTELYNNIPGVGGLKVVIEGIRSLNLFGKDLENFGVHLKAYADSISGIENMTVIEASATGAKALAELANNIPEQGGLKNLWSGIRDLGEFGGQLEAFGTSLSAYSVSVSGVEADVVQNSVNAAQALSGLAENLPSIGGMKTWFGGDNSMGTFGENLSIFGSSLNDYYTNVKDINIEVMGSVLSEFTNLVNLAKGLNAEDANGMAGFVEVINRMGDWGIDAFVQAFDNGSTRAADAVRRMIDAAIAVINSKSADFDNAGKRAGEILVDAIDISLLSESKKLSETTSSIGRNVVEGVASGINNNLAIAGKAAANLGDMVDKSLRKILEIHSPSRVTERDGREFDRGLSEGIAKNEKVATDQAAIFGNEVHNRLFYALDAQGLSDKVSDELSDVTKAMTNYTKEYSTITNNHVEGVKTSNEKKSELNDKAVNAESIYWDKLLKIYKSGSEKQKYAVMSMAEFQKQIIGDITETWNNYTSQLASTRDSIMNQMNLFDAVESKEAKSKEELKDNLEDQITAYREYAEVLQSLNSKLGDDSALNDYLKNLGVDSLAQLKVINEMTDAELSDYAALYDTKMAYATNAASTQLSELQRETETKLNAILGLYTDSVNALDFGKIFDGSVESLNLYIDSIMAPIDESLIIAEETGTKVAKSYTSGLKSGFSEVSNVDITEDMTNPITSAMDDISSVLEDSFSNIGFNSVAGIASGATSAEATSLATSAAGDVMNTFLSKIQEAGEIHSPSELMKREVGAYIPAGIAEGIVDPANLQVLLDAAQSVTDMLVDKLTDNIPNISQTGTDMVSDILLKIQNQYINVTNTGSELVAAFILGMTNKYYESNQTGTELAMKVISGIRYVREEAEEFLMIGIKCASDFLTAIKGLYPESLSTGTELSNKAIAGINITLPVWIDSGRNAAQGFINGILEKLSDAADAGAQLANAAYEATQTTLDINSPSRKMFSLGSFGGEGFIRGLNEWTSNASRSGSDLGKAAIDNIRDAIKSTRALVLENLEIDPTITPRVDLSGINKSASDINAMFNDAIKMTTELAGFTAYSVGKKTKQSDDRQGKSQKNNGDNNTYQFIQNNNSPRALNRVEIYRQTQNQFQLFKEAMKSR